MVPSIEKDEHQSLTSSLSNFKVLRKLSDGRFTKVVMAETPQDKRQYAIKIIRLHDKPTISYQNYNGIAKIQNEIKIMKLLGRHDHPYILKLYSVISNDKEIDYTYSQNKIYLILEYCCRGELSFKKLSGVTNLVQTFRQITLAVEFLHSNGIIHRDIKPSNILMDQDGNIKLSDFGISYRMSGEESEDQFELGSTFGTPLFMPPELCTFKDSKTPSTKSKCKLDFGIDIWSMGVTFYWLVFQKYPFFDDNEYRLFNKIAQETLTFSPMNCCPVFNNYSNHEPLSHGQKISLFTKICDLLEKTLNKNTSKRYNIEQVKKSEALTFSLGDKDKRTYLKFNDPFKQSQKESSYSSFSSIENAFSRLRVRKKVKHSKNTPPPIDISRELDALKSEQALLPDISPYVPQSSDGVISDLSNSSSSNNFSDDSAFVNSESTHQLFPPAAIKSDDFNNSSFSLPLFDNRMSGSTMMSSTSSNDYRPKLTHNGINSAPITPLSPTYASQLSVHKDSPQMHDTLKLDRQQGSDGINTTAINNKLPRSKAGYNLSKMTA